VDLRQVARKFLHGALARSDERRKIVGNGCGRISICCLRVGDRAGDPICPVGFSSLLLFGDFSVIGQLDSAAQGALSRKRRATTTPERNDVAAIIVMAHDRPRVSAIIPAESAL
jgi:hypothetical protein